MPFRQDVCLIREVNGKETLNCHNSTYIRLKKKGAVAPVNPKQAYKGSGGIAPLILNLGAK
jgi:hypothetical protein